MSATYFVGETVTISAAMELAVTGDDLDPTTVQLLVKEPNVDTLVLTYGTDDALVRDSAGHYHADITLTSKGTWHYQWKGSDVAIAIAEGSFVATLPRVSE